jgi:hypothetical protein
MMMMIMMMITTMLLKWKAKLCLEMKGYVGLQSFEILLPHLTPFFQTVKEIDTSKFCPKHLKVLVIHVYCLLVVSE